MGGAITTPGPEGAQTYREIIDSVRLARRELQAAPLALRNDLVHLDAFFNSGHIDGLSATIDRPISFYDSITATDPQPATHPSLESLKRKIDLLQIIIWILKSDFLRLHLLEPVVGARPMSYPSIIDDYGLKDQSIYTAFFLPPRHGCCGLCTFGTSLTDAMHSMASGEFQLLYLLSWMRH